MHLGSEMLGGKEKIEMPVFVINATTSKTYREWKEVFDSVEAKREAAGIEVLYVGHALENEQQVLHVQRVSSKEVFMRLMDENRDVIAASGVDPSSVSVTVCTD